MSNPELPIDVEQELTALMALLCDEQMSETQFARLEEILSGHPAARAQYLSFTSLHVNLREGVVVEPTRSEAPSVEPLSFSSAIQPEGPRMGISVLVMVAGLILVASFIWLQGGSGDKKVVAASDGGAVALHPSPVAVVVAGDDAALAHVAVGSVFQIDDRVVLPMGRLRLAFREGAVLEVLGPAEFVLQSPDRVQIDHGNVAAMVNGAIRPFTVRSGDTEYGQSDAAFSINASADGTSRFHVLEGTLSVRSITGGSEEKVTAGSQGARGPRAAEEFDQNLSPFVSPKELTTVADLAIPAAYGKMVLDAGAVGYYRFGDVINNEAENKSGNFRLHAKIHGGAKVVSVGAENKALHLSGEHSLIEIRHPMNVLKNRPYTYEAWYAPESIHLAPLVSAVRKTPGAENSFDDPRPDFALYSIGPRSAMYRKNYGKYRLHTAGYNLDGEWEPVRDFSKRDLMPQQWTHLAVVRKQKSMTLYINGEKSASFSVSHLQPAEPPLAVFFVGNSQQGRPERPQYQGYVDEIAIYPRPLSQKELRSHYEMVRPNLAWSGTN